MFSKLFLIAFALVGIIVFGAPLAHAAGPKGTPTIVTDILKLDDIGDCSRRAFLALDAAEYEHIGDLGDGALARTRSSPATSDASRIQTT